MDRDKKLKRIRSEVHHRLAGDSDLREFLDRDASHLSRAQALRGLILDFMGEVARSAYHALDVHRAKRVYRQMDALSTGLLLASDTLRDKGILEYTKIASED